MSSPYSPYQYSRQQQPYVSYYNYERPYSTTPVRPHSCIDLSAAPYQTAYAAQSVRQSSCTPPPKARAESVPAASPSEAPILPRYRGKHIRAMSAGSSPSLNSPEAGPQVRYMSHQNGYQGPIFRQRHVRASMSASTASVDTDSTTTQTSMSSAGSVNSVEDDKRAKGAIRMVRPTDEANKRADAAKLPPNAATPTLPSSVSTPSLVSSATSFAAPPAAYQPAKLVLPSDLRRRSVVEPSRSSSDLSRSAQPVQRSTGVNGYPIDVRSPSYPQHRRSRSEPVVANPQAAQAVSRVQQRTLQETPQGASLGSPSVAPNLMSAHVRTPSASDSHLVEPKRKSRSFSDKLRGLFSTKSVSDDNDDAQSILSTKSSRSTQSVSSFKSFAARFTSDASPRVVSKIPLPVKAAPRAPSPQRVTPSRVPPSRVPPSSVSPSGPTPSGVPTPLRVPTPSGVPTSPRVSTPSRVPVPSRVSTPSRVPVPLRAPSPKAPSPSTPVQGSSTPPSQPDMPTAPSPARSPARLDPLVLPRPRERSSMESIDSSPSIHLVNSVTEFECDNTNSVIIPPRPPSPALKSAISDVPSPVDDPRKRTDEDSEHLAALNLSAGDIFPGGLKPENVETIVDSVQRTGSFKRQPSTSKRTEDEVVPDAEEVEAEEPEPHPLPALVSAMKKGDGKKRTGKVHFANQILVYKTYSALFYDRVPDLTTCDRLGEPGMAQKLREELNHWKKLMPVHPSSVENTQFFYV